MNRILLADDKKPFRDDAKKILQRDDEFSVVDVTTPEDAIHELESGKIDAAVIDLRLRGGDKYDRSGLDVARRSDKGIPIIMVSEFGDAQAITEAVSTRPDGYPLLVRFLSKEAISDRPEVLRSTVREALGWREVHSKTELERIDPELLRHYKSDSRWARFYQALHYGTTLSFVGLIFWASYKEHSRTNLAFTLLAMIAGEITNIWISHRAGSIAQRADKNHSELLQATRFSHLFEACSAITNPELKDITRSDLIQKAADNWLVTNGNLPKLSGWSGGNQKSGDH